MVCENCKQRHANVTITQVADGQKIERHYCEVCASQFQPYYFQAHEEPVSLQQFISSWFGPSSQQVRKTRQQEVVSCPKCHFTYNQFLQKGKFGCSQCYEAFGEMLPTILEKIQAGTEHISEVSSSSATEQQLAKQIAELREAIQQAIVEERFEDAAKCRDQIQEIQSALKAGGD